MTISYSVVDDILADLLELPEFVNAPAFENIEVTIAHRLDDNAMGWSQYEDDGVFSMELSKSRNKSFEDLKSTIAHELIHITLNNFDNEDDHDEEFQLFAKKVSDRIGIDVT
jgi:predicted SprT family Zn-dependent metalloprotease